MKKKGRHEKSLILKRQICKKLLDSSTKSNENFRLYSASFTCDATTEHLFFNAAEKGTNASH